MEIRKTSKNSSNSCSRRYVKSARSYVKAADDEDMDFDVDEFGDSEGLSDAIDDVADNVEDIQDTIDDIKEDDVEIAVNNNIADHYIAECNRCNGIFISAVVDSDQVIDHVSGICPLCGKDTDQYLKWVIRNAD